MWRGHGEVDRLGTRLGGRSEGTGRRSECEEKKVYFLVVDLSFLPVGA